MSSNLHKRNIDNVSYCYSGAAIPTIRSRIDSVLPRNSRPCQVFLQAGGNDLESHPADQVIKQYDKRIHQVNSRCSITTTILLGRIPPKLPESDHLPVTLDIRVKCQDECPTSTMHYHQSNQWTACTKYVWTKSQLPLINSALNDNISEPFHSEFINAIIDLRGVENVAVAFNDYVNQACERVCNLRKAKPHKKRRGPAWFDPECRFKRSEALRLCDLASRDIEQITSAVQSCISYKATKQRKKREYMRSCIKQLETAFDTNRTDILKLIDRSGNHRVINSTGTNPSTLFKYYEEQCVPPEAPYFDHSYEYSANQMSLLFTKYEQYD